MTELTALRDRVKAGENVPREDFAVIFSRPAVARWATWACPGDLTSALAFFDAVKGEGWRWARLMSGIYIIFNAVGEEIARANFTHSDARTLLLATLEAMIKEKGDD